LGSEESGHGRLVVVEGPFQRGMAVIVAGVYACARLEKHSSDINEAFLSSNVEGSFASLVPGFELRAGMEEDGNYIGAIPRCGIVKGSPVRIVGQVHGERVGFENGLNALCVTGEGVMVNWTKVAVSRRE
jgi:hypothetical protein